MAKRGVEHHDHVFDENAVRDILSHPDLTLQYFAVKYGASCVAVWKVRNRVTWAWLDVTS